MRFTTSIKGLVLALAIAPFSIAVPQGWQQGRNNNGIGRGYPAPITNCYTDAVTKQTRRPNTKWSTRTTSCTWTSTTTLTVTTTPVTTSTVTKTETKTSTAPPTKITATYTSTTTTTTTTTSTSTSTSTTTTTTTISTSTIVPTSTGFIPIETSVPGSTTQRTPTKSKKRAPGFNPNVEFGRGYSPANLNSSGSGAKLLPAGDVNCYVNVGKCATATVKRTITITAPKSTATTTTTSTTTVTTTPGCTTTTTTTTTSTSTSTTTTTTTTTSTSTETSTSFTSTSYAACATPNLEYYVNNVPVSGGNPSSSLTLVLPNDASNNSPYDCCVSLILNPIGAIAGFTFTDFNIGLNGQCYIFEDRVGQCALGQASGLNSPVRINANLQVPTAANANGYCGVWSPPDGT